MARARRSVSKQASVSSPLARILLAAGVAASAPANAGVIASTSSGLSFETVQQSMWGPDGPSVVDTGTLFVGPQWSNLGPKTNVQLPFGLNINTSAIPEVARDFLGIPNPVTIGSTSRTSIDIIGATSGKIGFDFRAILDPGSVDALYGSTATLSAVESVPGSAGLRRLTLASGELNPAARLTTRSPQIDIESNFITQMTAAVGLDGKFVTRPAFGAFPSGCPFTVLGIDVDCLFNGQSEQSINLDPSVHKATLLNVDDAKQLLKFTNTELTILGQSLIAAAPDSGQIQVEFDMAVDVLELVLLAAGGAGGVPIDVTATDTSNPKKPRKSKDIDPTDILDVKVSVGDMTLYVPILDTESAELVDTRGGPVVRTSGQTNLARIDLDADLMASILFAPAVPVLGATAGIGVGPISLASIGFDLLDADVGALFLGGQEFAFRPQVMQTLAFSEEVRYNLGDGIWRTGDKVTTEVGAPLDIEFDRFKDLEIVPTYVLANEFTNLTRLLGQPVFEAEILRLNLNMPFPIPDPPPLVAANFFEEIGDAIPLATLFDETFALAGFAPVRGETLFVSALQVGDVPEPGSLALSALALALLAARARAARRSAN